MGGNDTLNGLAGGDFLIGGPGGDSLSGGDGGDMIAADAGRDRVDAGGGDDFVFAALFEPGSGPKDPPSVPALASAQGGAGDDFLLLDGSRSGREFAFRFGGSGTQTPGETTIAGFESGFVIGSENTFGDTLQASSFRLDGPLAPSALLATVLKQITNPANRRDMQTIGTALVALAQFNGFDARGGDDKIAVSLDSDGGRITRGLRIDGGSSDDTVSLTLSGDAVRALAAANGEFNVILPTGKRADQAVVEVSGGEDSFGFADDLFNLRLPANLAAGVSITPPNANELSLVEAAGKLLLRAHYFDRWNVETGGGNDNIALGGGDDTIDAKAGRDALSGGAGDDLLMGGDGADRLNGGDGIDTAVYARPSAVDVANPAKGTGEARGDSFISIETFKFGSGADSFRGGGAPETALGGTRNDNLAGNAGNDTAAQAPTRSRAARARTRSGSSGRARASTASWASSRARTGSKSRSQPLLGRSSTSSRAPIRGPRRSPRASSTTPTTADCCSTSMARAARRRCISPRLSALPT